MLKITEFTSRISDLKEKAAVALAKAGVDIQLRDCSSSTVRLVFAGQYSAGKSSILKMLTGREDIVVDANITTQETHTYDWQGVEVVDTPGIHTQLRPDHDEISYEAIASADMLVFVITNELFDSCIADHFRKLAIDKDKAGEMILVVNKMDRTAGGNTAEQRAIIVEDLKKVIEPYTPEQLHLSFLDAKSYLDSVNERETDPEYADELVEQSGYAEFVETLNRFVREKEIPSKLTTDLYVIDDCLERAIKELQPKSSDSDIDALEESFLQQKQLLLEARGRLQQEVRDIYTVTASKIRDYGLDAANLLVEGCRQDEVEEELQKYVELAEDETERCQEEAVEVIDTRLKELGQQLEVIENSEFSQNLKSRLSGKFEGLPEGIKRILTGASTDFQKAGQTILKNAYKPGVGGGLKLTNFSGSEIHKIVLKVGHALNIKFKPWQAVKITKGIAKASQVLNALGVGLSVFLQIKSDRDEEKIRADLRTNRQNVRSRFNAAASELEDYARKFINEYVYRPLENSIAVISESIKEIRDTRADISDSCRTLENLQSECRNLIQDIHAENA